MSPGGRADAAHLRRVIADIEAKAGVSPAREGRAAQRASFSRTFDSALGGGLAEDGLHEIAPAAPADGPAAMAFALALAGRFLDRRPASALLIGESFASLEAGALYGPGLVAHGLPLHRLVFVSAPDAASAFWAMEEALKCGAPAAVVAEIWSLKRYGLARLPPPPDGCAKRQDAGADRAGERLRPGGGAVDRRRRLASRSPLRQARRGRRRPGGIFLGRLPAWRGWSRRGRDGPQPIDRAVRLEWRYEEGFFDDPTISLALAAAAGDRPRAASHIGSTSVRRSRPSPGSTTPSASSASTPPRRSLA